MEWEFTRRRRWPAVAIGLAAVVLTAFGIGAGAARSTADAASTAAALASSGHFGAAIAVDDAIATRTGPVYILDRSDVQNASLNAERTVLSWATTALTSSGVGSRPMMSR